MTVEMTVSAHDFLTLKERVEAFEERFPNAVCIGGTNGRTKTVTYRIPFEISSGVAS